MIARPRNWNLTLCKISGIPIRVHATFPLLLVWVWLDAWSDGQAALGEVAFVVCLFLCVIVHELGHALTARLFSIPSRDITLYPFGGVAMLQKQPSPGAELFIALAGPFTSMLAALVLYFPGDFEFSSSQTELTLLSRLMLANLALAIFNLLPALPMDGGRALRAFLSIVGLRSATLISAILSQILLVGLLVWAIYAAQPLLVLVSLVVLGSARQEYLVERARLRLPGSARRFDVSLTDERK